MARLAPALAVVGRVEPRALVVDGDGMQHALERSGAADFTLLRARLVHAVEHLEQVPVRALVLVDRHGAQGYQRRRKR